MLRCNVNRASASSLFTTHTHQFFLALWHGAAVNYSHAVVFCGRAAMLLCFIHASDLLCLYGIGIQSSLWYHSPMVFLFNTSLPLKKLFGILCARQQFISHDVTKTHVHCGPWYDWPPTSRKQRGLSALGVVVVVGAALIVTTINNRTHKKKQLLAVKLVRWQALIIALATANKQIRNSSKLGQKRPES